MTADVHFRSITLRVLAHVRAERHRQDELKSLGKIPRTCADLDLPNEVRLAVLLEEVGEVAREVLALGAFPSRGEIGDVAKLRAELCQVAAVAVAWIEGIDRARGCGI